jgi:hypothetical protein
MVTAEEATDINIKRRMRIACCILKATDTHSEYVILIAFPLQQWLHEGASMLCHAYIACLVELFTTVSRKTHLHCNNESQFYMLLASKKLSNSCRQELLFTC